MSDHRHRYPQQYSHPLCGKYVEVVTFAGSQGKGTVERVVSTRFGTLAIIPELGNKNAWRIQDCRETTR